MKQKQYNVSDKLNKTTTNSYNDTLAYITEQQYHHNQYCNCNNHKQSKEIFENVHHKDVGDFHQIKSYYQTTGSGTLNQTIHFIYNKYTTPTITYALHSLPYNNGRFFVTMLLLLGSLLLGVQFAMGAPQSCILCDKNDLKAKDPQTNYEEFLFEHQVTRQDAINALKQLNDSFYEGTAADSSCNGVRCTEKVLKYCLGPQFINDHCWCEVGHSTEGLPFVPHICYVGEKIYKTSVGSCFFYEEVKDCCCSSLLAKEWRHISAGSNVYSKALLRNNCVLGVIILLYLLSSQFYK